jgi:hypothetical protein
MATQKASPSPSSDLPSLNGVSWFSVWRRRLYWLISALSGTLETEKRIAELRSQKEQMRKEDELRKHESELRLKILQKETERLAELESKIDGLFLKYNIGLKIPQKPDQP